MRPLFWSATKPERIGRYDVSCEMLAFAKSRAHGGYVSDDGCGMRHQTNELSFERPEWLLDRTNHIFAVTAEGPSPFNIVMSRTSIEDETLDQMTERVLRELGTTLEAFDARSPQITTVASRQAMLIEFDWLQNGQRLYQRQALLIEERPEGRVLHQIAATASADARQGHVAGFNALLTTLRFRGTEGDGRSV